jgi:hypothetical protein
MHVFTPKLIRPFRGKVVSAGIIPFPSLSLPPVYRIETADITKLFDLSGNPVSDGGYIDKITDQGSIGGTWDCAGGTRPQLEVAGANGKPCWYRGGAWSGFGEKYFSTSTVGQEAWCVINPINLGSYHNIYDTNSNTYNSMLWLKPGNTLEINAAAAVTSIAYSGSWIIVRSLTKYYTAPGGSKHYIYVNEVQRAYGTRWQGRYSSALIRAFQRGNWNGMAGRACALIVFNNELGSSDIAAMWAYLKEQYNITY